MAGDTSSIGQHFEKSEPEVHATYKAILNVAKKFGPVQEEAKKTSIHLVRRTAFAGVATRKNALILTLKSGSDVSSKRITKHEQVSANRWHLDVRLAEPSDVDQEVAAWLKRAYEMTG